MENILAIKNQHVINNQAINIFINLAVISTFSVENNTIFKVLPVKGYKNSLKYIEQSGFAKDENIVDLPSHLHYYNGMNAMESRYN